MGSFDFGTGLMSKLSWCVAKLPSPHPVNNIFPGCDIIPDACRVHLCKMKGHGVIRAKKELCREDYVSYADAQKDTPPLIFHYEILDFSFQLFCMSPMLQSSFGNV